MPQTSWYQIRIFYYRFAYEFSPSFCNLNGDVWYQFSLQQNTNMFPLIVHASLTPLPKVNTRNISICISWVSSNGCLKWVAIPYIHLSNYILSDTPMWQCRFLTFVLLFKEINAVIQHVNIILTVSTSVFSR